MNRLRWSLTLVMLAPAVQAAPAPPVAALAYSHDGKVLAAGVGNQVVLIDPESGGVIGRNNESNGRRVSALAVSRDGNRLAVASGVPGQGTTLCLYPWDYEPPF